MVNVMQYLRRKAGLTQSDLADVANVHQSLISKLETGRYPESRVAYIIRERIARRLGCRVEDLTKPLEGFIATHRD